MVELISIHIGKTAGTTFRAVLSHIYQEQNVLWDYPPYPYKPPAPLPENIRAIHGHVSVKKYQGFFPNAKRVVWLRHPLFRLISEYYFARLYKDKGNHLHRSLIEEELSFSEFVERPAAQNIMSGYITGTSLEGFFFVGLQEFYASDLKELESMMGWEHQTVPMRNANPEPEYHTQVSRILEDVDLVQRVAELNSKDMALYEKALALRAKRTGNSVLLQETLAAWNRSAIMLQQARSEKHMVDIQRRQLAWQLGQLGYGPKQVEFIPVTKDQTKKSLLGFHIDEPSEVRVVADYIDLKGWVIGKKTDAQKIKLLYENTSIFECRIDGYRPDVAEVYSLARASISGFKVPLVIGGVAEETVLDLVVVLASGEDIEIGKIKIARISRKNR